MTIGQLATEIGVPVSTIRYWESTGVLPKPARVNGKRAYPPETVQRIALLKLAQVCGFSLDEIRRLHKTDPQLIQLQTECGRRSCGHLTSTPPSA